MPRLIVVEGPDGAGKSTLLKKLERDLGRPVFHTGGPPATYADWSMKMARIWSLLNRAALVDRMPHISEEVYSKAFDREPSDPIDVLRGEIDEFNPLVIYCRVSSIQAMMNAISRSPKSHKSADHLAEVLANFPRLVWCYDKRFEDPRLQKRTIRYSWPDDKYEDLLKRIKECVD